MRRKIAKKSSAKGARSSKIGNAKKLQEIVKRRKPKGATIHWETNDDRVHAYVTPRPHIFLKGPVNNLAKLFYYLHEVGHIVCKHLQYEDEEIPKWLQEYEAEQWAIKAMRAEGFRVSRALLNDAKKNVRDRIEEEKVEFCRDKHILRWAYSNIKRKPK